MLKEPISITAISSISSLGNSSEEIWNSYLDDNHYLSQITIGEQNVWGSTVSNKIRLDIENLRESDSKYRELDDSVLFAMYSARHVVSDAGWDEHTDFGINIGSSRGATSLFEKYHEEFLREGKSSTLSSPTTTLGNISSWVAHDLKSKGPDISHSITCSTALHALLNGVAWIQSGMADKFLIGGSEAPLTPFTIAQMQALKIYSEDTGEFPCRAFDLEKKQNTMVLGEAAAMACLEKGKKNSTLALIEGIGFATEPLEHNVSISADALCFQQSMKMALGDLHPDEVDAIVMHAPGTVKGDLSEFKAIEKVFCNKTPFLTTNKWKVGHTFGASGMLSVEMAILMLQYQQVIKVPKIAYNTIPNTIQRIIINAVGFGGNAVSILLKKTNSL
ncbi:beta-ketoacyl synthase N-terminal-like domain-containing protein [Flagellimonas sp. CMM7]|uniref:beta-ketoacyl synthase N-terminal-like domain-containing protein n=1 Tax=Flagellimonas sp. CMM7 TaxID=2654676 RepID=UPI0013CFF306|nr:beta-ketoacyl synthase N-terminal-like domain-containing protein [Flagellimonas sp. CMM7]UII78067.1 beta-ketoacyl synthase [Flagellimonas sp. CMM7]